MEPSSSTTVTTAKTAAKPKSSPQAEPPQAERPKPGKKVVILGGGRFGRGVARVAADSEEYEIHLASHTASKRALERECGNVHIYDDYGEAIGKGPIVILAVGRAVVYEVVANHREALAGKIVVDVSNREGFRRAKSYDDTVMCKMVKDFPNIRFVKCFNTVSAHSLEYYRYPVGFIGEALLCGDDQKANEQVALLASDLGIPVRIIGGAEKTVMMENVPLRLLDEWRLPVLISLAIILLDGIYAFMWVGFFSVSFWGWLSMAAGFVFGGVAINLLAIVYLPGALAQFIIYSNYPRRKATVLPRWLTNWMSTREQFGLIAFWLVILHVISGTLQLSPNIFPWFYNFINMGGTMVVWQKTTLQVGLFLGTLAFGAGIVVTVTSLPSVAKLLSWKEWIFLQRFFGYAFFGLALAHVPTIYNINWTVPLSPIYFQGVPPNSLIVMCFPFLVAAIKICALLYVAFMRLVFRKRHRTRAPSESQYKETEGVPASREGASA